MESEMLLLVLALGCADKGGDDTATPAETGETGDTAQPAGPGTLALTFAMDPDYMAIMDEDPVGTFYGSFWKADEVTSVGPIEGAEDLGGITVEGVDLLPDGGPTGTLFVSGELSGDVVVLGFLDSDANADPEGPDPDDKDPVTLPGQNRFTVVADAETVVQVYFGLLNP